MQSQTSTLDVYIFFNNPATTEIYTLSLHDALPILNLRKTLLMASSVRLKPLNCSRLPCVYAQETLTFLLTQKKTSVFPARTQIGRAVQQECRDRSRMPSSA